VKGGAGALAAWLALTGLACGADVPAGGVCPTAPRTAAPVEPADLLPADLDLVVRWDLGVMRGALGDDGAKELVERGLAEARADGLLREALASAEVVWLGVRVRDFEAGDRVLVVESARRPTPDDIAWKKTRVAARGVDRFDARAPAKRGTTASIFLLDRAAAFVSPVETDAVARVLRDGPDALRGQPAARGLVSVDYRPRGVSARIRDLYPALARLLDGLVRVHAVVSVVGGELDVDARGRLRSAKAAADLATFLETIASVGRTTESHGALFQTLEIAHEARMVTLRWRLPPSVLRPRDRAAEPPAAAAPARD
jgi:hypothetical protein